MTHQFHILGIEPKRIENICPHKHLYINVHSSPSKEPKAETLVHQLMCIPTRSIKRIKWGWER